MKQYARILLLLVMVIFLCSCGRQPGNGSPTSSSNDNLVFSGKKSEPSNEQLHTDMQDSLTLYHSDNYDYNVSICEYEVERSLTEETHYSAQFNITAESEYAEFHYVARVAYTKYDQGWCLDSCTWELEDYKVIKYPDDARLFELRLSRYTDAERLSIWGLQSIIDVSCEGDCVVSTEKFDLDWSSAMIAQVTVMITWSYDVNMDEWYFVSEEIADTTFLVSDVLEGTYKTLIDEWTLEIESISENSIQLSLDGTNCDVEAFTVDVDSTDVSFELGRNYEICYKCPNVSYSVIKAGETECKTDEAIVYLRVWDRNTHNIEFQVYLGSYSQQVYATIP